MSVNNDDIRVASDITGDANYKAKWSDLLALCFPDAHLTAMAFVFLLLAAMAQIYIPRYTGNILDLLTATYTDEDDVTRNANPSRIFRGSSVTWRNSSRVNIYCGRRSSEHTPTSETNGCGHCSLRILDSSP